MEQLLSEVIDRLEAVHRAIDGVLADLPDAALDWSPGPEMNSLAVLLAHALGAERYWIGDVAGGEPSGRDREAEFRTTGRTTAAFTAQARATLAHSRMVLSRLTAADLVGVRTAPLFGQRVSAGWAILHGLEHPALHAGHMEITRQLWLQQAQAKGDESSDG